MKSWDIFMAAALVAGISLWAHDVMAQPAPDGVPGDRLVVPLPDVSSLPEAEARDLTRNLAELNVLTENCAGHEISDAEWQLMTGTTDRLIEQLGLDALDYDREYFRPAFSVLDDPENCDRVEAETPDLIARLESMGGSTRPITPGLAQSDEARSAEGQSAEGQSAEAPQDEAAQP
ncbi:hypothetical protein Q4511_09020 [Paracoccus sp. 1_MG-2023]|uniref:hypothetical protein n=1 Tax=unclassified Paracoccus (in: a-proteobacteria) TaxID=2688777 RepID=UPI001C08E111|nr:MULTISPECIES: hypothetical protein [unclassified Paracoccus (in: a-proteobacteria)]MBU2957175.1 hypothetical protein [Paracoccus sp. C2R09]MDO6669062.1 hypothetical protein [Paracoccus sp. 1_MG-2023]